jgi:glycerol-3-phosphate O-acyltransferase
VRRLLRGRFGRVHVNLGEPVRLDALLARHAGVWRRASREELERPRWVNPLVDELADTILRNINAASAVTPVNLVALALLGTPRQAMLEVDLVRQVGMLQDLLRALAYSPRVTLTASSPQEIVDYVVGMNLVVRERQRIGTVVHMPPQAAVLATYYRNNMLHLVALPSLIACGFRLRTPRHQRLAWRILRRAGLYLRWASRSCRRSSSNTARCGARPAVFDAGRGVWRRRRQPGRRAVLQLAQAC